MRLPRIGQGTWGFGERPGRHKAEVDALREGFSLGMTLVDTAELYSDGESERVVADAIRDCRDEVFLITKIWPSHADPGGMRRRLEASLRRLRVDFVDVALLHWPTRSVPLTRQVEGLTALREASLAREVGVSNFPTPLAAAALPALYADGPERVFYHELPYSLEDRRVERSLLPQVQERLGVLLAYSPLGHGRLLHRAGPGRDALAAVAARHDATPAQVALAFTLAAPRVVTLAKAADPAHVRQNAASADLVLQEQDLAELERAFPRGERDIGYSLPPYGAFLALAQQSLGLAQSLRGRHRA